jgi:hypothetical protein
VIFHECKYWNEFLTFCTLCTILQCPRISNLRELKRRKGLSCRITNSSTHTTTYPREAYSSTDSARPGLEFKYSFLANTVSKHPLRTNATSVLRPHCPMRDLLSKRTPQNANANHDKDEKRLQALPLNRPVYRQVCDDERGSNIEDLPSEPPPGIENSRVESASKGPLSIRRQRVGCNTLLRWGA